MMSIFRKISLICICLIHIPSALFCQSAQECEPEYQFDGKKVELSEKEWKQRLTSEQFRILRKGGTEPPFKNSYFDIGHGMAWLLGPHLPRKCHGSKRHGYFFIRKRGGLQSLRRPLRRSI
jgi:hypothetical protein